MSCDAGQNVVELIDGERRDVLLPLEGRLDPLEVCAQRLERSRSWKERRTERPRCSVKGFLSSSPSFLLLDLLLDLLLLQAKDFRNVSPLLPGSIRPYV